MERFEILIPDASIIVKWFVKEEYSEKARKIKDQFMEGRVRLIAPNLLIYEATNALRFHPIAKLPLRSIVSSVRALENMSIATRPGLSTWQKAVEISLNEQISIYDAVYIAMAFTLDAKMVTADRKLPKRVSEKTKKRIMHIRDMTT